MSDFLFLVPLALGLGLVGLAAFFWALRAEQYDDLDGAAERVLLNEDRPLPIKPSATQLGMTLRERE